jgi:hypothetical protein
MATVGYGCGSERNETSGVPGASKNLDYDEAYYKYEGQGANKRKVALTRREKRKVLFEAGKKLEGQ